MEVKMEKEMKEEVDEVEDDEEEEDKEEDKDWIWNNEKIFWSKYFPWPHSALEWLNFRTRPQ